jgi:hypothetical protein
VRRHVWAQRPSSQVADTDLGHVVVGNVDATWSRRTTGRARLHLPSTGGFECRPTALWCNNTQEMLALALRPGNAGPNTVADHITVVLAGNCPRPARSCPCVRTMPTGRYHVVVTNTAAGRLA